MMNEQVKRQVTHQFWRQVNQQVWDKLRYQIYDQDDWKQIREQVWLPLRMRVEWDVEFQVRGCIAARIKPQLKEDFDA